jgi:hypothetical protein
MHHFWHTTRPCPDARTRSTLSRAERFVRFITNQFASHRLADSGGLELAHPYGR